MSSAESEIRAVPYLASVWRVVMLVQEKDRYVWVAWELCADERAARQVARQVIAGGYSERCVRIVRYDLAEVLP